MKAFSRLVAALDIALALAVGGLAIRFVFASAPGGSREVFASGMLVRGVALLGLGFAALTLGVGVLCWRRHSRVVLAGGLVPLTTLMWFLVRR